MRRVALLLCLTLEQNHHDYRKALDLGQVLVAYARLMLVGPGGVGKSSLFQGLMNKKLPEATNSTQLADVVTVKPSIPQQLMAKAIDEMPWVEVTDSDEINELVGLILLVDNVTGGRTKSSRFKRLMQKAAACEEEKHIDDDYHRVKDKIIDETFLLAIEQARVNPHAQAPESEIMINVWDCAGQSVYLDILSAFLTPKTIFMLLYDARKDLDDRCIILSHCRGQVTESQQQNMSYMDLLFQWMASIHITLTDKHPVSIPKYPRIITVGTHGDDPQVKTHEVQITEKLSRKCEGRAFTKLISKGYIVNNTSAGRGDDEDPTFKELRKEVHRFTSDPSVAIATPVTWVLFRKVVQKVAVDQPILPYEKGLEIAVACSIPSESFDSVLKFYHDIAVFLHFDHIHSLKDFVIVSPQWLVKQLAKVLALEGFEGVHDPDLWKNLRENGILMEPLYKEIWRGNALGDEAMMDLLENCSLAAPIETKLDNQHYSGKKYFVPSALPPCSDDQLKVSVQNSVKTACTLHLLFNTRYVPPGYLTRLVTTLSKNKKCHVSFSHGIYRNRFMFHFAGDEKNYIDEITISQHITSIHVNVSRPNERKSHDLPISVTCHEIMKTILACSSEIERWLPSIEVTTAFTCEKCSSDDHFIEFNPHDSTTQTRPLCQRNKICTFNPSQQHWLQISQREEGFDSKDSGILTEAELQFVATEINRNGNCKELAETLEMTNHLQLEDITVHDLLQRWQNEMQKFKIHIKSHLIHHLRCINLGNTAERLKYGQLQPQTRAKSKEQRKRKRQWSFYAAATIVGIIAIVLAMLLMNFTSQSWNGLKSDRESKERVKSFQDYFPRIDDRPTLTALQVLKGKNGKEVRIIERIGDNYNEFGTILLKDDHGDVMKTIAADAKEKVVAINREILTRWLDGQGIDINWKTLVRALRDGPKLNTLADDIITTLEADDKDKYV